MWQRVVKNTFWLTSGEILGRALRVILILVAARSLGAGSWGIFSYILTLAALFTIVADLGLGAVLTREVIRQPEKDREHLAAVFWLKLIFLAAATIVIITLAPFFTKLPLSSILFTLTALLVISDSLRLFATALNRAREKMHLEAIVNVFTQAMILTLGLGALLKYNSLQALTTGYVIGSVLGTLLAFWTIRHYLGKIFSAFDKKLVRSVITAAWPFALVGLVGAVMLSTDILFLGWLRTAEEIGYYSAGQKIIFVLYLLPALISTAVFPSLTRLANKDRPAFGQMLSQAVKLTFLLSLPLTLGGLVLARDLIVIFYGPTFTPAITAFKILLLTLAVNFPATLFGNALFAYDRQIDFLKFSALGAGLNIIFNLILIPPFGIEGSAGATLLTQIISNAFIWWRMQQVNQFRVIGQLGKIGSATLVMTGAALLSQQLDINFFLIVGLAIIVYLASLYFLKEEALWSLIPWLD